MLVGRRFTIILFSYSSHSRLPRGSSTDASVFDFTDGPPVHDALTLAYVLRPELFTGKRYRAEVETSGTHTTGCTSFDLWDYKRADLVDYHEGRDDSLSWGSKGKNVFLTESLDVRPLSLPFCSFDCLADGHYRWF